MLICMVDTGPVVALAWDSIQARRWGRMAVLDVGENDLEGDEAVRLRADPCMNLGSFQ